VFSSPSPIAEYERTAAAANFAHASRDFPRARPLGKLGLPVPVMPDGAFYAVGRLLPAHSASSWDFVFRP